jgi:ParB/RepB/Spo0J family partition protein
MAKKAAKKKRGRTSGGKVEIEDLDARIEKALGEKSQGAKVAEGRTANTKRPPKSAADNVKIVPLAALKCNVGDRADDVEELAKSIRRQGLLQPLIVTPKLHVVDGRRRWQALTTMKGSPVEVAVAVVPEDADPLLVQITANEHREDFTLKQRVRLYKQWMKKTGKNQSELSRSLGYASNYVGNKIRELEGAKEIAGAISSSEEPTSSHAARKAAASKRRALGERRGRPIEIRELPLEVLPEGIRSVKVRVEATEILVRIEHPDAETKKTRIKVPEIVKGFERAMKGLRANVEGAISDLVSMKAGREEE